MEYGTKIEAPEICDSNFMRFVGYEQNNDCIRKYFSQNTVNLISRKVTELTMGIDPQNRPIVVPDSTICNIMSSVQESYRPPVGDIYSRYIIPTGENAVSMMQNMIDQVIEIITSDIRNNMIMEQNNKKLTKWTTLYGDFNAHNLRAHAPIKILEKRPNPFEFHMRY
tara:strand:- start:198 stop:698 length:501 start_codon:yes stop_codon:yes gene_type:complete